MSSSSSYRIFLYWLLSASLIGFALYVSWDLGVLESILKSDITRITVIILCLLFLASIHCGYRSWYLTVQLRMAEQLQLQMEIPDRQEAFLFSNGQSLVQDYLEGLQNGDSEQDKVILSEVLAEKLRGSHQVGWFVAGLVIKLGLLGTVVGFVLMLSSISGLDNLDISDIKQLMQQMTQGMGVAMNTTMVGLVSSMLLGMQYLLLDRCADQVVITGVEIGQEYCLPASSSK
ncbi:MAG: MotA/TolQ/ExbB proton channel family protein [Neptuniibacter sp.]